MKSIIIFIFGLFFMSFISKHANSQIHIGVGINYGNRIEGAEWASSNDLLPGFDEAHSFGLEFKGVYDLNSNWALASSLQYYFPRYPNRRREHKGSINLNVHRVIWNESAAQVYILAGINNSMIYYRSKDRPKSFSKSKLGTTLGIGFKTKGKYQFYSDLKWNTPFNSPIFSIGVLFRL